MRLHEITDKNFNLKKAIIEKKVCPTRTLKNPRFFVGVFLSSIT